MSTDDDFSAVAYDFLAEVGLQTSRPIRRLLRNTDEQKLLRFFQWTRNRQARDRTFDAEGQTLLGDLDEAPFDDLVSFFNLASAATDDEILSFVRRFKQATAADMPIDYAAEPIQAVEQRMPVGASAMGAESAAVPVLVGRDWIEGDDETPREPALLPPPPPLDADPAYSMRQRARPADEPHPVRSAFVFKRQLDRFRSDHPFTKDAEILAWFEFNEDGEFFLNDELAEFSLIMPDRRARVVIMSPEIATKMGVEFGPDRSAQTWMAARLETGEVVRGLLTSETWARFAEALERAPKAGPLPPAEPEPPRRKRRRPDRFPRPYPPAPRFDLGEGWA
jgi:hypothetical protein